MVISTYSTTMCVVVVGAGITGVEFDANGGGVRGIAEGRWCTGRRRVVGVTVALYR